MFLLPSSYPITLHTYPNTSSHHVPTPPPPHVTHPPRHLLTLSHPSLQPLHVTIPIQPPRHVTPPPRHLLILSLPPGHPLTLSPPSLQPLHVTIPTPPPPQLSVQILLRPVPPSCTIVCINPFTAPAGKFAELNIYTQACKPKLFMACNKSAFKSVHFDANTSTSR